MISVVTPTYNRAYILGKLKGSLDRQTSQNFEWLIVDDGSTDNTKSLVEEWIRESGHYRIRYFWQENGGKHRALNYGIPKADGEFVFIVDSDDYLTDDAVETVEQWVETIREDEWIVGVSGLRAHADGKILGDFPRKLKYIDVKNSHRYIHHLDGDKAEAYRKSVLVCHPFPEFEGERFIGEGAVWNQLSLEGGKVRWFNKVIYICEYLEDGLTTKAERLNKNNFKGYTYNTRLNYRAIVFPYNLMATAIYFGIAKELGYSEQWVRDTLEMTTVDYLLCRMIRFLRRMP